MTAVADASAQAPVQARRRNRRAREISGQAGWAVLGWVVGIAFFIPILWMVLTAFKPESAAETWPPKFTFSPTLAQFRLVFDGMGPYLEHSALATVGSTILVLVLRSRPPTRSRSARSSTGATACSSSSRRRCSRSSRRSGRCT